MIKRAAIMVGTKVYETKAVRPARAAPALGNQRVVITAQSRDGSVEAARGPLVATADAHDRAHGRFDPRGMLYPAADEDGRPLHALAAKPRRYHPTQMVTARNGARVAWDSAFDGWDELRRELESAGIRLSAPALTMAASLGRLRVGPREARMLELVRRGQLTARDGAVARARELRAVLEPRLRQAGETAREMSLRKEASAILRRARNQGLTEKNRERVNACVSRTTYNFCGRAAQETRAKVSMG